MTTTLPKSLPILAAILVTFSLLSDFAAARKLLDATNSNTTNTHSDQKYGKVLGYVVCDACREKSLTSNSVFLSGMTVSLTCKAAGVQQPFFTAEQQTDSQGRFAFDVPAQISGSIEASKLCSTSIAANKASSVDSETSCSSALQSLASPSLTPYVAVQGHPIYGTGPFVYTPAKSPDSKCSASSKSSKTSNGSFRDEKAPAFPSFPNFGGNPFSFPPVSFPNFGGIPSSPASQFPVTSLFPPIPANPPPVFSQVPGVQLPPFSGFPQLPAFQFPFFAAPPPPGN